MKVRACLLASVLILPAGAEEVWISSVVNVRQADCENARPVLDKNAANQPLQIGNHGFARGIGAQPDTRIAVDLGAATRFSATAGVDDATTATSAVHFEVQADGQPLWQADLKKGDAPAGIDLDVQGKKRLVLVTYDTGNAYSKALVDWADAKVVVNGDKPASVAPPAIVEPREILTPPPARAPQINGARVFGVRPGRPVLFTIAATGDRPMKFTADNLPDGLVLDSATGRFTGTIAAAGTYAIVLHATNDHGVADGHLRIEVGDKIALTPPLGWNSWNCWGVAVDQDKVFASARAMAASGLVNHGWSYVNIDDTWQGTRTGPNHALQPNEKFPDLKKLADQIHALGLKIGIYSTPWIDSYAGFPGGSADNAEGGWEKPAPGTHHRSIGKYSFAAADARQWAAWGIDYLKYDWNPNRPPETEEMANALRASGRDIVYSLSNSAPLEYADQLSALANCWRTTGDIQDTWGSLHGIWARQEQWRRFARPGHWNDPDMLVVGDVDVGRGKELHPSRLTPNEQYTHISLWSLLSAPLLIGCPIERLDAFTLGLLTNDEVLAIDQDELGTAAEQIRVDGRKQVYLKPLVDGSVAVGLFNLAQTPQNISIPWSELNIVRAKRVRDLWRQKDLAVDAEKLSALVPRHGVVLVRVWPGR